MRKLEQNIAAGETITLPSCKTFVFLRSEYPVDFKFITMFNKIDRTITNFSDSFSVTANTYFLRVEIKSLNTQTLSCILIEDTGIDYTPITGDVFISNDKSNAVPISGIIENDNNSPIPCYSPQEILVNTKLNSEKFYKSNYAHRFKSCCYVPSQQATTDLECYALFPSVDYTYCFNGGFTFITEIWIEPETDNYFEVWERHSSSYSLFDYNINVKWLVSLDGYVHNYYGHPLELHEIRYKNISRTNLENESYNYLMYSFPIKANEIFHHKFDYPIPVPNRYHKSQGMTRVFTFTTKSNCNFSFNLNVETFEDTYHDDPIY